MAVFRLDATEYDRLVKAIKNFPGDAEKAINEVLHGEGSQLIQESVKNLMPVSGRKWKGKKTAAKSANSLTDLKESFLSRFTQETIMVICTFLMTVQIQEDMWEINSSS